MDFEANEDQKSLQQEVRKFLHANFDLLTNMKLAETLGSCTDSLWRQMAQLGWTGISFPERFGGSGLGFTEQCLILEEMGRTVMTGPYFASIVLGGVSLSIAGSEEQKLRWLPGIADGTCKATLAYYDEGGHLPDSGVSTEAVRAGTEYELKGTKRFVLSGDEADLIICPARMKYAGADAIGLFVVPSGTRGVTRRRLPTFDITRPFTEVTLEGVAVPADHLLGDPGRGQQYLEQIRDYAIAALCAEMAGGCRKLVEMATEYAKARVQFGKPIGAFQAIKHKCADMHVKAVTAEATARYLTWTSDQAMRGENVPLSFTASIAKAYCGEAFSRIACDAIQIHGGNGFSWEYGLHLFLKRAKACEALFGDAAFHQEAVLRSACS